MRDGLKNMRGVLFFMLNAFIFYLMHLAIMIYFATFVVSPVISFFQVGVFRLPEWAAPIKLLTAPVVGASIITIVLGVAYILGFKFEKDKIAFSRNKSDENFSE